MGLNLTKLVIEIKKKNPNKKFTARELAGIIEKSKQNECKKKMQRSKAVVTPINSRKDLISQIVSEIWNTLKNDTSVKFI